jgi:hypothetical protein
VFEPLQRMAPDQAHRLIFLSGGVFTAQTRERLDQIGAPRLEEPVSAQGLHVGRPGGRRGKPSAM